MWKHASPPPDYVITEAKYGSSRLGMTNDGRQMSTPWITGSRRLENATNVTEARKIMLALVRGRVEKRLHHIDPTGKLTETILL